MQSPQKIISRIGKISQQILLKENDYDNLHQAKFAEQIKNTADLFELLKERHNRKVDAKKMFSKSTKTTLPKLENNIMFSNHKKTREERINIKVEPLNANAKIEEISKGRHYDRKIFNGAFQEINLKGIDNLEDAEKLIKSTILNRFYNKDPSYHLTINIIITFAMMSSESGDVVEFHFHSNYAVHTQSLNQIYEID
jgi:hypothetical protein